ncbi:MAG: hypothetical protein LW806_08965 [Planctomycetaceae bacterium]|nr:hypothetical protein [Planctomycetaceae bacterium]
MRAGVTALSLLLFAGPAVMPVILVRDAAGAQEAPRGEQSAQEDQPAQGRRDRGARGAMPLPPDWPRAGGFGTRERGLIEGLVAGDAAGADLSRREITDEELSRALKLAARVSEDWGRTLAARAEQDPAQLKAALRTTGRRLFALLVLEERAPKLFEASIAEMRGAIEKDAADTAAIAEEIRTRALSPRQPEARAPEARDGEDRRGPRDDRRGPRDPQGAPRGDDAAPPADPSGRT